MKRSICMATYNGDRFINSQLQSILLQLGPSDEVVIVDDASRDNSTKIILDLHDHRIQFIRNDKNLGVSATFEMALRSSTGDIIFLSDQDDLWLPNKVKIISDKFLSNPDITLVASDAIIIDQNDSITSNSFFKHRGNFSSGTIHNFIKNKHLGCTLAFRRAMLKYFLPIPKDIPRHDIWFGLINSFHGKTEYINKPLIAYRRHRNNLSPSGGTSMIQKIAWRWNLIKNLYLHLINKSF